MPIHRRIRGVLLVAALAALAAPGCSKTRTVTLVTGPGTGSLTLHFDHFAGGMPLVLDGAVFTGVDGAGNGYSVTTLRYFVSNVQIRSTDGRLYGTTHYHYVDAGEPATHDYTLGAIPAGTYDHLVFTFGLDEQWNVSNNAITHDHTVSGMEWPPNWGGGWHYMILEGMYGAGGPGTPYKTHTGRRFIAAANDPSGQGPDTVEYPHYFQVHLALPGGVTIDGDAWQSTLRMELDRWYDDPAIDLSALFPTGAEGVMVNLTVQNQLRQNGPDCFALTPASRL